MSYKLSELRPIDIVERDEINEVGSDIFYNKILKLKYSESELVVIEDSSDKYILPERVLELYFDIHDGLYNVSVDIGIKRYLSNQWIHCSRDELVEELYTYKDTMTISENDTPPLRLVKKVINRVEIISRDKSYIADMTNKYSSIRRETVENRKMTTNKKIELLKKLGSKVYITVEDFDRDTGEPFSITEEI